jgi:hypothetical protein
VDALRRHISDGFRLLVVTQSVESLVRAILDVWGAGWGRASRLDSDVRETWHAVGDASLRR